MVANSSPATDLLHDNRLLVQHSLMAIGPGHLVVMVWAASRRYVLAAGTTAAAGAARVVTSA